MTVNKALVFAEIFQHDPFCYKGIINTIQTRFISLAAICIATTFVFAEESTGGFPSVASSTLDGIVSTEIWNIGVPSPVPANDNFSNAVSLTGTNTVLNFSYSTIEVGEPTSERKSGSVWYRWTAAADGALRISLHPLAELPAPLARAISPARSEESIFYPWGGFGHTTGNGTNGNHSSVETTTLNPEPLDPPLLAVFRGTELASLELLARGPNIVLQVRAGEEYNIAFERQGFFGSGNEFFADFTAPPANDNFSNALPLSEVQFATFQGHGLGATTEPNEPGGGGNSVWFRLKAATFGSIKLSGAAFSVFTGSTLQTLQPVPVSSGAFFGKEGVDYSIAVHADAGFYLHAEAPRYRVFETNSAALFPPDLYPSFYGLRGATAILYAKTPDAWRVVEIEPIFDFATQFLIRPLDAHEGLLRVVTIDENMPSPRVELRTTGTVISPVLIGLPGQTCAVSSSADLSNWSASRIYTIQTPAQRLPYIDANNAGFFFRVTQSLPVTAEPIVELEPPH